MLERTRILPLALALPFAAAGAAPARAQSHVWSGPLWERALPPDHLPSAVGGAIRRLEVGRVHADAEPDLVLLVGTHLVLAKDFASRIAYHWLDDQASDFAIWHGDAADRIAFAGPSGCGTWTSSGGVLVEKQLGSQPSERVKEVRLGTERGIAVVAGSSVTVYGPDAVARGTFQVASDAVDVAGGDFLTGPEPDLAILTATHLYWFRGTSSQPALVYGAPYATGKLEVTAGSAVGLDLLLWQFDGWLVMGNELWLPSALALGGMDVERCHVVDYFPDALGLEDLVVTDRAQRNAWVLQRLSPAQALAQNAEYQLNPAPGATWVIPIDTLPAGTPLASAFGDHDLDGDRDLLSLATPVSGMAFTIHPAEPVSAEDLRPRLGDVEFREAYGPAVAQFRATFLPLGTPGVYLPATATHLEVTIWQWKDGEAFIEPQPLQDPAHVPASSLSDVTSTVIDLTPITSANFDRDDRFFFRLRGVRKVGNEVVEVFPSRVETASFDQPIQWIAPAGWYTTIWYPPNNNNPDGTGSVRGGGGGPSEPGGGPGGGG